MMNETAEYVFVIRTKYYFKTIILPIKEVVVNVSDHYFRTLEISDASNITASVLCVDAQNHTVIPK